MGSPRWPWASKEHILCVTLCHFRSIRSMYPKFFIRYKICTPGCEQSDVSVSVGLFSRGSGYRIPLPDRWRQQVARMPNWKKNERDEMKSGRRILWDKSLQRLALKQHDRAKAEECSSQWRTIIILSISPKCSQQDFLVADLILSVILDIDDTSHYYIVATRTTTLPSYLHPLF